jgi:hypothetical protein
MTDLSAFHNDPELKAFVLNQLALHREADKLIKGDYWKNGKGCSIGCTLEAIRLRNGKFENGIDHHSHQLLEDETGVPLILWRLNDQFFEALPDSESQAWPERFTSAIYPGTDLTMIWPRFAHWLLTEEVPPRTKNSRCLASLAEVGALYREWIDGVMPSAERWLIVEKTTYAAAEAAAFYAVAATVYAAVYAANANAAAAANAAVYAAKAAAAGGVVVASYRRQSDKLIELLAAAKT